MILATIKSVVSYFGRCVLAICFELFKFGMVLMLTYMMGMAIFYVWDRSLIGSADKMLKTRTNYSKENIDPKAQNAKYPFVVEIPLKKSIDSIKSDTMRSNKISSKEEVEAMKATRRLSQEKDSDEEHEQELGKTKT